MLANNVLKKESKFRLDVKSKQIKVSAQTHLENTEGISIRFVENRHTNVFVALNLILYCIYTDFVFHCVTDLDSISL